MTYNPQSSLPATNTAASNLSRNIWKLYAVTAAQNALVAIPTFVLFLQDNGLSLQEVFLLQALFSISVLILEVPSGYLSDRWGRKHILATGSLTFAFGMMVYALGDTFWQFLFAEFLLAIGVSFHSGTVEAMAYDSLQTNGQTTTYRRTMGNLFSIHVLSGAVAGILGGFIAEYSLRATFWAELPFMFMAFLIALSLTEPARHKLQEVQHFRTMGRVIRTSLVHNVSLRSIIILTSILSSLTLAMVWFTQPYQEQVGLPLYLFGIANAVIMGGSAITSKMASLLEKRVDDRKLFLGIAIVIIGSYVALGFVHSLWGILLLLSSRSMWGAIKPISSDMVNRLTSSDVRATVLSISSFGSRLIFACFGPLLGYWADVYSLNTALLLTGLIGALAVTIVLFSMRKVWSRLPR